ncbi:CBS domain-containing protein [Pendulispora brunnea]|uniref:CBS domain-containing protein n=1 Tax=Pendulispora brunnea TaxID=2905690 RepID=A0ABZ2JZ22_9BACT
MVQHRPTTRLPLRQVEWMEHGGSVHTHGTFCPFRRASTSMDSCRGCPHFGHLEGDGAMECLREPTLSHAEAAALLAKRRICTGRDNLMSRVMLGELGAAHTVCTAASTPVSQAAARVVAAEAPGCIVIDERHHPVTFVSRTRLASSHPPWLPVAECPTEPFLVMPEDSPLDDVIARMTQEHQRVIVATDVDARATGLVTDLDVLRWVGERRRA